MESVAPGGYDELHDAQNLVLRISNPALVALWLLILSGPGQAQRGGPYVGISVMGQRLDVGSEKTVDNTPANNVSLTPGRVHQSGAAESSVVYGTGYLAGYRIALRPTGIYLPDSLLHTSNADQHGLGQSGLVPCWPASPKP